MTPERARELVDSIRVDVDGIRDRLLELYQGRGWLALGFGTWGELCEAEFGSVAVGRLLPRSERRELVQILTGGGMSTRAIGKAMGIHDSTVVRDRGAASAAPGAVVGLDGKAYQPREHKETQVPRKDARIGATTWSRKVQAVSAACPMQDLTPDEVEELLGAATFLRDYCQGELIRRAST